MLFIAEPVNRFLQHQPRFVDQHGPVFKLIEAGRERVQNNRLVAPQPRSGDIPAGVHRGETAIPPVAPAPGAFIRQEVIRQPIEMQRKITHFILMGPQNRLQTPIDTLLGHLDARERQANFIDIEGINHSSA
ncbi:Uncharacterised protein [Yokenella regensburgei]|nr:Uncharacterised protein [Yokenella regensburgei]